MDERVKRALQQWPNVPDVYGWLALDARGRWLLRGETISNPKLVDFINRNYGRQDDGGYAFQNGPQKVHVRLAIAPWVADLVETAAAGLRFLTHTGAPLEQVAEVFLTTDGQCLLQTELGPALVRESALAPLLPHFRGPGGAVLPHDSLEHALAAPEELGLVLQLTPGHHLPVLSLAPEEIELRLDFIRDPGRRPD